MHRTAPSLRRAAMLAGAGVAAAIAVMAATAAPALNYSAQQAGATAYQKLKVALCAEVVCSSATITALDTAARVDDDKPPIIWAASARATRSGGAKDFPG